jgi:uncharacterized 2Fe-2S/4Fe-4S cluster protein (DUF4445 family)
MSRVRIRVEPRRLVLEVPRGAELADLLAAEGVELPCGGRGECGGCRVRVLEGGLPAAPEDLDLLGPERVAAGWRLACRCRAEEDATIEVEGWRHPILGDETPFAFTPREGFGVAVDVGTTTLVAQLVDLRTGSVLGVETALNAQARYCSDLMSRIEAAIAGAPLTAAIREQVGGLVSALVAPVAIGARRRVILDGNTAIDPGRRARTLLGGDAETEPAALARVVPAGNTAIDQALVVDPAGDEDLPGRTGRSRAPRTGPGGHTQGAGLARVVLVGNTAMHHLFGGLDVAPLAAYPFETPRPDALRWRASELGWPLAAEVVFLPCLGGFVGSDVLAGLRAIGLDRAASPAAMLDLGTNGEIVVAAGERLYCASAAAGPAFEGARISCGMRAAAGAISSVDADAAGGRLVPRVLGGGPARGICGSGLVDAVATGLQLGLIERGGRLAGGASVLELADGLVLTQRDIRELQLAKGALAVGLRLLSARAGTEPGHLDRLSLAGAFGNYVSRESARRIGLFEAPLQRVASAGNTALLGAKLALFDDDLEQRALRRRIVHVPLAAEPGFADAFAEAMRFPG